MLEEELTSICVVLEGAAESIQDKELKALVSRCCGNLSAAAEQARALENGIPTAEMDFPQREWKSFFPKLPCGLSRKTSGCPGCSPSVWRRGNSNGSHQA